MDNVLKKLRVPAFGLIFVGAANFVFGAFFLVSYLLQGNDVIRREMEHAQEPERTFMTIGMRMVLFGFASSLILGIVIFIGGLQMRKGLNRKFVMVAAVLALLPLTACASPFGMVFGIWALVVLNGSDVKAYFAEGRGKGAV